MYRLPIGNYVESGVDWLTNNLSPFFGGIKAAIEAIINGFEFIYIGIPFVIMLLLVGILAYITAGKKTAIFSIVGSLIIYSIDLWKLTMKTFALVTTATVIALIIGIPLGIWMSRSNRLNKIMRPILDFMQTMPAFVYLIPAVYFFDLGPVPGAVATIIFAMPPIVRLTSLGIRQVPADVIEASRSFGSTPSQMLFKVQIPLAMPTILAGLNQTIMLSLSMVVISAMIGSGGLGDIVLKGISQMKIGDGFEGGLAVVILAMILDRITQGIGKSKAAKSRKQ
ncbi:glycine/betaine ABC transporter permease [Anaerocolumna cellulosilytica]|uniref:Glycine/betaine ABC transporter permease n=1 Tax=Anaerocolumna cellulosilytica TaxID=433286 RepID=A0A6S6R1Y6_9FIRM|nr:proline/glycine betaine ABC transporter permease [Anaerocolumna cellulosilytica]MBB5197136.1 glycine betaine/proline transport system permease protein [Anaerocolumna cellulosilytica]BCJ95349.1 glycine/betaine ABC transporter permease [Anaerocolumna cellulosilytica]